MLTYKNGLLPIRKLVVYDSSESSTSPIALTSSNTGMSDLGPNLVRLAKMGQIRDFFRSDFSAFGAPRQMHWNLIWKSPGFVPFGANLTHFEAKPTIPARYRFVAGVVDSDKIEQNWHRTGNITDICFMISFPWISTKNNKVKLQPNEVNLNVYRSLLSILWLCMNWKLIF